MIKQIASSLCYTTKKSLKLTKYLSKSFSTYLITTPIFYVNADPHIGHLYSAYLAEGLKRVK